MYLQTALFKDPVGTAQ